MTLAVPQATKDEAERIRAAAANQFDRIRMRTDLTVDGVRSRMAKVYVPAKNALEVLQAQSVTDLDSQVASLKARAWGISDIAGNNPVDRAAASMSFRDAMDRAAQALDPAAAQALLQQAGDNGDELLARAVAYQAWSMGLTNSWPDVLDQYCATRPVAAQALNDLRSLTSIRVGGGDLFAFMMPTPPELVGLADYQIASLAGQIIA